MARKLTEDESLLKHPRRLRKSLIDGERLTDTPSVRMLKIWGPIAKRAELLVLANEPNKDGKGKKNFMDITFNAYRKKPKGFMRGALVSKTATSETRSFSAEAVLLWCWQRAICDRNPRMIYALRQGALTNVTKFINSVLDTSEWEEYYEGSLEDQEED